MVALLSTLLYESQPTELGDTMSPTISRMNTLITIE